MNHGGIGYIDREKILLPVGILDPLSIEEGAKIYGLYYPPRERYKKSYKFRYRHDFLLTPIPYRYWPRVGRLIIRLNHKPGALVQLTELLNDNQCNIISAECNRSGHRYATWVVTMAFDSINIDNLTWNEDESYYEETWDELERLEKVINSKAKKILFTDDNYYLKNPIEKLPHCTLAYHYKEISALNQDNPEDLYLYDAFQLQLESGELKGRPERLKKIFDHMKDEERSEVTPTFVIVENDSKEMTVRCAIIPQKSISKFFHCEVHYVRTPKPDTSRGLMNSVIDEMKKKYNMWRVFNYTRENEEKHETGSMRFLLEDLSKNDPDEVRTAAVEFFNNLGSLIGSNNNKSISKFSIMPINTERIQKEIDAAMIAASGNEKDVFISYCVDDIKDVDAILKKLKDNNINYWCAREHIGPGDHWSKLISENIIKSRRFCVLYSNNAVDSKWVAREIGAAWVLNKQIDTYILDNTKPESLPDILQPKHVINHRNLEEYIEKIQDERYRDEYSISSVL